MGMRGKMCLEYDQRHNYINIIRPSLHCENAGLSRHSDRQEVMRNEEAGYSSSVSKRSFDWEWKRMGGHHSVGDQRSTILL